MPNIIIIRIVPQSPVDANTFTSYLNPPAPLGPLKITAFDLSFDNPTPGQSIGSASYTPAPPSIGWTFNSEDDSVTSDTFDPPVYPASTAGEIFQQVDYMPATFGPPVHATDYYELESVATAIIEVPSTAATFGPQNINLTLQVQWGSQAIPFTADYYDVPVFNVAIPDLSAWSPSSTPQADPWGTFTPTPSLYISLPVPPSLANPVTLQLPTDGTPPPFDALLKAVNQILTIDPGPALTAPTTANANAGDTTLQFAAGTAGIVVGMAVSGAGIPSGTTVIAVTPAGLVTLSQEVSANEGSGNSITFTLDLGALTFGQCQNIAYEIVWSQQPPMPAPPSSDPVENLYTNPPNTGALLNGGMSSSTPNQQESDRQQFEGQLKSYYAVADTTADRMTNYVFALSAAIACEQMSIMAPLALLDLPMNPGQPSNAPLGDAEVILTGLGSIDPPANFGVPAAYFYALAASMPTNSGAQDRYQNATGSQLQSLLKQLTAAINAETVTDAEAFATVAGAINAAQAARRISALGVPTGSATPLAPLDALELLTSAETKLGNTLSFSSTAGVTIGMLVSGANIAANTTVTGLSGSGTSLTINPPVLGDLAAGSHIVFTPAYSADLQTLIKSWLGYPLAVPGVASSQAYQATDDATKFWPLNASLEPGAFLNLVLCALTQGYIIPAPFNVALGDKITEYLKTILNPPTVATLASVSVEQWTQFFQQNPTWLPPSSGNTTAQIEAFISNAKQFYSVGSDGPSSSIFLATNAPTLAGNSVLFFASTAGIIPTITWSVTGAGIPAGTTASAITPTTVGLSNPVLAGGVSNEANILFTPNIVSAASSALPLLQAPFTDWLNACLGFYGPFTFGNGFNLANLKIAAGDVFGGDQAAQDWLVDVLVTIDALYQVMKTVALPVAAASAPYFEFSVVEALYARGFKSAADMTELSSAEFQQALTGTVAYDLAGPIYTSASAIAPPAPAPPPPGSFQSVNPDGSLTNCIPPPCLSPLGPVAYLNEMLQVSPSSTCENPLTPTAANTLGSVLAQRRGPLGNLAASCANLETPLPLIDIVNECLEFMGSVPAPTNGTVYDTSTDALAGHLLCHEEACPEKEEKPPCHEPCKIFAALPEYSTPATPVSSATPMTSNSAVEPLVYNNLKTDFSDCCLPYSQAIDISRTYLRHFRSCRFEEMRTFRKCITEFVLDPVNEPTGFQSYLWRYPVRIDTAIEYLGITPDEYELLFQGTPPVPCAAPATAPPGTTPPPNTPPPTTPPPNTPPGTVPGVPTISSRDIATSAGLAPWQLYGFASAGDNDPWTEVVAQLPQFLERTCLTYCEFVELWKSGFVSFSNGDDQKNGIFPDCEPCCLDKLWLQFPETPGEQVALVELAVFIRLWRKLKESHCFCYSFAQLRDICDVLHLFNGGLINPDFIRQFAAFQMLRDHFQMELADPLDKISAAAIDADRTQLLALWVGPTAAKWNWAVKQLIERIEHYAQRRHKCDRRSPEFIKVLVSNLDPLSQLAGFDPTSATDNWHALPTHTLRFAEVLAKIYASNFSVGEIIYLFTADHHLDGDDPFPLQEDNEALDSPMGLPDDETKFSLWHLRRKLLEVQVADENCEEWQWKKIDAALQEDFGFAHSDVLALGQHFFPGVLAHAGYQVDSASTRYLSALPTASTSAPMWNIPADGPFQYDPTTQQLWTQLPLTDAAVIAKLTHVHSLNANEQKAVQDLYFQPRTMLAGFALLFSDFSSAEKHLIEERDENERWKFFRKQFVLCHRRCRIIAEHLSQHVAAMTGQECPESEAPALLILRELFADENLATADWENDAGTTPPVMWTPPPEGGAFAALLGLTGTGLDVEYKEGDAVVWRDVSGPLSGFGRERDKENCPVPTVLPSMSATLTPQQMQFVSVHNGFLMKDATEAWLGGAQGCEVKWSGALLVDHEGTYEFWAGAPTPGDEKPDWEVAERRKWRVILKRGERKWILLSHHWLGEEEHRSSSLPLKRGVYELKVELIRPAPEFLNDEQVCAQHTGFQVKYSGPDTQDQRTEIPHHHLFSILKDQPLGAGITTLSPGATSFLSQYYTSSLRDIRRTYQRAFKALLFAHRFALSAKRQSHGTSELEYMLAQAANFAGAAYYRTAGGFVRHAADFDFNLLPLLDDYHPPTQDSRTHPSQQRMQAMFDWWERLFDYTMVRKDVRHRCDRHLWHLFEEAEEKQPAHPAYLLRHIGADSRHWHLDLRYHQGQSVPVYAVSSIDLEDDRWTVRAWHADQWIRALQCFFAAKDITVARPDLWASDDPSAVVAGETETGNANLSSFLCDGCFENGKPWRYEDVKRLNDGLRERGRNALLAYLCHMDRVPLPWLAGEFAEVPRDLSDLLLLDVEAGICERASRIDEAITAVQNFVLRARLQLEPGWTITHEFARMWDREFATFHIWQECKRRHLYKENWIEWTDLEKARRVEAFRFLESKLHSSELTVAAPGGLEWWPDERPPVHKSLELLQKRESSEMQLLPTPREGLNLLATPERDARPSWLTAVQPAAGSNQGNVPAANAVTLPFWMETAIRLGTRFYRIAAAGVPPAAMGFEPHKSGGKNCVSCCEECGCTHPALVDEYYFWLIDGEFYDPPVTPTPPGYSAPPSTTPIPPNDYQDGYQNDFYDPNQQEAAFWQDITQLPQLLDWPPSPMVRLAWCRVHNGEFQQPRRSHQGVPIQTGSTSDLSFLGRTADSLTFSVSNAVAPEGYSDPSAPGFRYDLATDDAVVLPLVTQIPALDIPTFVDGKLPAYPYFVYDAPGSHLFPLSPFSPSLAVAQALRSRCRFEAALKWYRLVFDPLQQDCTWVVCASDTPPTVPPPPNPNGGGNIPANPASVPSSTPRLSPAATTTQPPNQPPVTNPGPPPNQPPVQGAPSPGACCDSTDITCAEARNRSIILHYAETLKEWGEATMRRGNSTEAFQKARLIFDTADLILGKMPCNVRVQEPATLQTVSTFKPAFAPLNPRLLNLYAEIRDRLNLIRACIDSRRLNTGSASCEMPYFGNSHVHQGWRTTVEPCADENDWCYLHSPYRFMFLIAKAQEQASKVQELGAALLAAFEKGDAEYLASLRAGQERELLTLGLEAKKDQWRDADWQIEALQKTKAVSQANLVYTNGLIAAGPGGLINGEIQYQNLTSLAMSLRSAANITEGIGEGMRLIPDIVLGAAGFGGSPVSILWIPLGTKIGEALEAAARLMNNSAEINSMNGQLNQTDASWLRRLNEWTHQARTLAIDIQRVERQILGAQRQRDQALQGLDSHRCQMEQSAEVQNFLRDKFTAHDLYLFLQKETAALYHKTYDLAMYTARQAQHAFNLERGHTTRHFLPECAWDNLHDGLMAGERLSAALRQMEKAYLDENVREYELTKHFSLRMHFPMEFLRLRTTGCCEIDIPEWMFDLDFPGQYMRRIKNVTLTIPCVTGPYTGVHCRLTLISSVTRIDPRLSAPVHDCCCPEPCCCECCGDEKLAREYELCPDDPRAVRQYAAREAIATSTGQNDSGMFELNFNDERYLPFEYMGAVSRWRIELPPENNYFPMHTLSDAMICMRHTSREGGGLLRRAANEAAHRHLPGDGWCFFDVRHEFPDAWQLFRDSAKSERSTSRLPLRLDRKMFPFVPGAPEVLIGNMAIFFSSREHEECGCPKIEGCPCPEHGRPASRIVEFSRIREHRDRGRDRRDHDHHNNDHHNNDRECELIVSCMANDEWPDLYCGMFDSGVGPLGGDCHRREVEFRFPDCCGEVERVFLLCRYSLRPCAGNDCDKSHLPVRQEEVVRA